MKLSDLLLNRWLYKDVIQDSATIDAVDASSDVTPADVPGVAAGGAAQDVNTGNVPITATVILTVGDWGWTQTCAFTSVGSTQVNWGAGVFKASNGFTYNISAGNTGVMSGKNYIYLDIYTSPTTYQVTTVPSTAVGVGKVLIAVANSATPPAIATYNLTEATQIVGDNILANTIDASKMNVGQLSAITADLGTITAGTITMNTAGFIRGGQTAYNTGAGFFLGYSGGAYRFSMGNGSTEAFTYNGTDLTLIGGTITGSIIETAFPGVNRATLFSGTDAYLVWSNSSNAAVAFVGHNFSTNVFSIDSLGQVQIASGAGTIIDGVNISSLNSSVSYLLSAMGSVLSTLSYILGNCCGE